MNGQDARFDSTIGVDGSSTSGSSVIFDVYGDGRLLYQSPTLTYGSGAIPIDVNVTGVTTLDSHRLGRAWQHTFGRPCECGLTHDSFRRRILVPFSLYTLTWQLSQNGMILSTQTADSFVFGAISGSYTLAVTVTDAAGDTATASTSVVVCPTPASAQFIVVDSHTGGNWIGTYGTQGYEIIGGPSHLPSFATVTQTGASTTTWAASTTDPGVL